MHACLFAYRNMFICLWTYDYRCISFHHWTWPYFRAHSFMSWVAVMTLLMAPVKALTPSLRYDGTWFRASFILWLYSPVDGINQALENANGRSSGILIPIYYVRTYIKLYLCCVHILQEACLDQRTSYTFDMFLQPSHVGYWHRGCVDRTQSKKMAVRLLAGHGDSADGDHWRLSWTIKYPRLEASILKQRPSTIINWSLIIAAIEAMVSSVRELRLVIIRKEWSFHLQSVHCWT